MIRGGQYAKEREPKTETSLHCRFKHYGVQEHEVITKEEYNEAWRYYFEWRNDHPDEDSIPAYRHMYNKFGGVPRKQRKIEPNAFHAEELNILCALVSDAILEEVDG